jgi:ABC-type lipoprotein release transport system permease subunit
MLVVALLVAIAGGAVTAGVAGARRAGAAVDRYIAESAPSSTIIFSRDPLDADLIDDLESDPRITGIYTTRIVAAAPVGIAPGPEGLTIDVPDEFWPDENGSGLATPRLVEGRYPIGNDEVAVSEVGPERGIGVGDVIDMELVDRVAVVDCIDGGECETEAAGTVTVTGVIRTSSDLAPATFGVQIAMIAPRGFVDSRGGDDITYAWYVDVFTAPGVDVDAVIVDYAERITSGDMTPASFDFIGARRAGELQHDALLIAVVVVAAAGLLIAGQAFGRFLARRSSDTSTLSALGMTTGQRVVASWIPGIVASAIGAVMVIPIAVLLSPLLPRGVAARADPDVGFHLDLVVVATGVIVTFAIGSIAALVAAARWASRSATSASTASSGTISPIASVTERLGLRPAAAMGSRFALEPGRGPRRSPVIPMLVGSTAAVTVVVGALVITSSLTGLLETPALYGATWDLQVSGEDRSREIGERLAADARADGVALVVTGELDVEANGKSTGEALAVGLESIKGRIDPVVLDGRTLLGPNEVLLGTDTMAALDIEIGDEILVSGSAGEQTMVVVGRSIIPVVSLQSTDTGVVAPLQTLIDLGGLESVADIDVQLAVLVTVADDDEIAAVGEAAETMGGYLDGPFQQSSVSVLDEIRAIPYAVASFTALLGALAIFHTLVVTGRRRRIDLATMRALGGRPRDAGSVISWQGGVAALAALAIGIPVGIICGRLIWRSIADANNVRTVIEVPMTAVLMVAVVSIIGASVVLAALPAWHASRRPPAADLRAE